MFELLSVIVKYLLTIVIYLFIFNIAKLIYTDIRSITAGEDAKTLKPHLKLMTRFSISPITSVSDIYPLHKKAVLVGRGVTCDIRLSDPHVSSEHAHIYLEGSAFFIEDLNSANGTSINGQRIQSPTLLKHGDTLQIGSTILQFSEGGH